MLELRRLAERRLLSLGLLLRIVHAACIFTDGLPRLVVCLELILKIDRAVLEYAQNIWNVTPVIPR